MEGYGRGKEREVPPESAAGRGDRLMAAKVTGAALVSGALLAGIYLSFSSFTSAAVTLPSGGFRGSPFGEHLASRLTGEGFSAKIIDDLLGDPRGEILKTTLAYAIVYREKAADYSGFLSKQRLGRATDFMARKGTVLQAAEDKYKVPAEVISSILMIESDFGNFRKLHRSFNVFATLVWADRPENFDTVQKVIRKRLPEVGDEKIRKRAKKKAGWGYNQLVVLLRIAEREGADPFLLEGSWAGAFGLPQFIPTSYWDYAVDGNGDRRVDLFDEDDAIYSIGNYLKAFGWKEGISEKRQKEVLRRYNNSGLYVDTVLEAAARLEKGQAG